MAKYFCTGCIEDEELYRHYALNVPLYTHFTSPIRRYADVMVHRALAAALGKLCRIIYCFIDGENRIITDLSYVTDKLYHIKFYPRLDKNVSF